MDLKPDSLILGYADELIAEHQRSLPPGIKLDLASLQGRLADTLAKIVQYVREEQG